MVFAPYVVSCSVFNSWKLVWGRQYKYWWKTMGTPSSEGKGAYNSFIMLFIVVTIYACYVSNVM
jgi:hypothetical protein